MWEKLLVQFRNLNISVKIMLYYFVVLILSITAGTIVYRQINSSIVTAKVTQMSMDTVTSDSSNFDSLIYSISDQTKMLISNQIMQNTLKNGNADYAIQAQCNQYLNDFINFNDKINSIYIFNNYGNEYYVDNIAYKSINMESIKAAKWYRNLLSKQGGYILEPNAGGIFSDTTGINYISMIRVINDINTQQPLGIMVVNISEDVIRNALNSNESSDTKIMILDDRNKVIISSGISNETKFIDVMKLTSQSQSKSEIKALDGEVYIISSLLNEYNWRTVSITTFNELLKQSNVYNITIIVTLLIIGVLFILGMAVSTLLVSKPIHKLVKSMKRIQSGEFKEVTIKTGHDEIGQLQDNYNIMIRKIQDLIKHIVQEQKNKRKMELDVLHSQIKPHFLYNSLDAISSLSLSGQPEKVYTLVKALGSFYRNCLNNGNEYITIKDELQIADNYLIIQNMRCGGMFVVNRKYDEKAFKFKIPRLILQPLIENAFKHGIRGQNDGVINIEAVLENDKIILTVEDNGIGMSEEQVQSILEGKLSGLGLKATIGRLKIFYNNDDVFSIESKKGFGTKISLIIPRDDPPSV
ncbi:MAG TPA: histidine kinase [Ruminiclostridium sp.]